VQIEAGEALEQILIGGKKVRHFTGGVTVRQPGQVLTAQEAFQFIEDERTVFSGGVRIDQGEGKIITGDSLTFVGKSKVAQIRGNVNYAEGARTLTTNALDYDPESGDAVYTTGGTINDDGIILTSRRGRYNRKTGLMYFYKDVNMKSPEFSLKTDSLHYNTESHLADFFGPTTIVNKDGVVRATRGAYNAETGKGNFVGRSGIDSPDYRLEGDKVDFDRASGLAYAQGAVRMFAKKDSILLTGRTGFYNRREGRARLYGDAILRIPTKNNNDTLYIRADSLFAVNDSVAKTRTLLAMSKVQIFQRDFQGVCDSLAYGSADSTLRMYRKPYLWSGKSQSTADTVYARMERNRIDSLLLIRNAFLISQDTLGNYNQVKGRFILADFDQNKIRQAYVRGNGQSIYFAVDDEKLVLSGMNRITCSNMIVKFDTANKLETITALVKPEAKFIPPKEMLEPEKRLKGFNWDPTLRPTLISLLRTPETTAQPKKYVPKQNKLRTFDGRTLKRKTLPKPAPKKP